MKNTLLFLWQLPQNIIGLLLRLIYKGYDDKSNNVIVRRSLHMRGGISLGKYIIVNQFATDDTISHELGHCRQSMYLGWLYLFVIGIPSLAWAGLYGSIIKPSTNGYYKFYTERWADRLGNVER